MDWPPSDLHLKSILVAWDLSPLGEAILQLVSDLAAVAGAKIELIHVVQPPLSVPVSAFAAAFDPSLAEKRRDEAERELTRVADQLPGKCLTVQTLVASGASVPSTLVELVNNGTHDLVAPPTHGRSAMSRILLGSVADKVVRASDKPVLVVRPLHEREEGRNLPGPGSGRSSPRIRECRPFCRRLGFSLQHSIDAGVVMAEILL